MSDTIMSNYNKLRTDLITKDRRFSAQNGKLCFDGVNLEELAKKYPTPFYVFSEK